MSKTIMITDDTLFMRVTLRNLLNANGYTSIIEASNGQEAVDNYAAHKPDLVFMDITMPVLDGISATKAITSGNPGAKVVMLTAMGQKNMVMEAIQAGAKDFIVKPFKPEGILKVVAKHLG